MYCISCGKNNVIPENFRNGTYNSEEEILYIKRERKDITSYPVLDIDDEMIHGGIIQTISAGYGSIHDGDNFIIAICDDCINRNKQDGTILFHGNNMYPVEEFTDKEKEKSKKIYRRRKNLDGLV